MARIGWPVFVVLCVYSWSPLQLPAQQNSLAPTENSAVFGLEEPQIPAAAPRQAVPAGAAQQTPSQAPGTLTGDIETQPNWRQGFDSQPDRGPRAETAQLLNSQLGRFARGDDDSGAANDRSGRQQGAPTTFTAQDRRNASLDRPLFDTHSSPTSLSTQRRSFEPNSSAATSTRPAAAARDSQGNGPDKEVDRVATAYPIGTPRGSSAAGLGRQAMPERSPGDEIDDGNASPADKNLPLWPTMALFFSLAANLFFGWIAWDAHSRYQDFADEMNESDARRERQTRRLRENPRSGSDREDTEPSSLLPGIDA